MLIAGGALMTATVHFLSHRDALAYAESQAMRNFEILRLERSNYVLRTSEATHYAPRKRTWQLAIRKGELTWA